MPLAQLVCLQKCYKRMGWALYLQLLLTTHHGQSLKLVLFTKYENKEQRIIPAFIKTIAEERNSAGRDFESLSGFSSYLNLRSAAPDEIQEAGQRPAVIEISRVSLSGKSPYLTGLVRRKFPNT